MTVLKIIAVSIVIIYVVVLLLLYTLQQKLIFYPGKLTANYRFKTTANAEEVMLKTEDGEQINGLFFYNKGPDVILYFHGNAGDLSGWQFVAEDFTNLGYNLLIIDYRGYGKSSGDISEKGFYLDAKAAFDFVVTKGFDPAKIIIYGRSIGSGVAVSLASRVRCKGLVLESPYSSLSALANEKLPFFFPSLYLRYRFDNIAKINNVKCPVIFVHGSDDTLIPPAHSKKLFDKFQGKKMMIMVATGAHNDLNSFERYSAFLKGEMSDFFYVD